MRIGARAVATVAGLAAACAAHAALRLPHAIGDHAVLQRGQPIHLWGWATPGARLAIGFHAQKTQAIADRLGRWDAWLAAEQAGGPYQLAIAGDGSEGSRTLNDILVGDVWFASGQSNMEMPLNGFPPGAVVKDAAKEIAGAANPRIRLFRVEHKASDYPVDDVAADWTPATPETAATFSAVAYFFGREIEAREHVPIGLIDSTWGGTPEESWVSLDTLAGDAAFQPAFAARARFARQVSAFDAMLAAEQAEDAAALAAGQPKPTHEWHPPEEAYRPAALFNGMVAPLTGYGVRGFLWYQGETNSQTDRALYYGPLLKGLVVDWRRQFAQGELPFLFAQISSFDSPREHWGFIRDQQRRALEVGGTAMAVTTDVGDAHNVHPADKQTVAARLALAARAIVYGERIAFQPPLFRAATPVGGGMRVRFDHGEGLTTRGQPVAGFELAGEDGRFSSASATIDGDGVIVSAPAIARPAFVRYDWSNVTPGALYNAAGLPASTFTSEPRPGGGPLVP